MVCSSPSLEQTGRSTYARSVPHQGQNRKPGLKTGPPHFGQRVLLSSKVVALPVARPLLISLDHTGCLASLLEPVLRFCHLYFLSLLDSSQALLRLFDKA